jgi:hypothetical protein
MGALDCVADIATRCGLDGQGTESRWRRDFMCRPYEPQGPLSLLQNGYRVFPGVRRPERDANHPPCYNAGLQMGRSYISTSPLCLHRHVIGWPLSFHYMTLRKLDISAKVV